MNFNPKELVMQMLGNQNPIFNNLINMAQENNVSSLENFARNVCKEKGLDFEKEMSNFITNLKSSGINYKK